MCKISRWLECETARWVREEIVAPEQASRIRDLYLKKSPASSPPQVGWPGGLIVFFGIGAVVIGLGIILLFAYNWPAIPKAGKLALVFGLVMSAHLFGLVYRGTNDWRIMLGEGLSLLGTMAFGSGIWMVAQIYHIDEHFPTGFLFWGLGALAMAWAMPSVAQALLATVVLTIWGCAEAAEFRTPADWGLLLIVFGVGGLVWRMKSAVLAAFSLAGLTFMLLFNAGYWGGPPGVFLAAFSLSVLLIAIEKLATERYVPARVCRVLKFFGIGGFICCAYLLTFEGVADDLLRSRHRGYGGSIAFVTYRWGLIFMAISAWLTVGYRFLKHAERIVTVDEWIISAAFLFVGAVVVSGFEHPELLVAIVFNFTVLGLSTIWIMRGCRQGSVRLTVNASLLLAAVVFARYFDLFNSLAARGAAFIIFGALLFAEGFYYRRMRLLDSPEREGA